MEKRSNIKRHSFLKVDIEYYFLFILTLILSIIGLIMISSSSDSIGERYFNDPYWFIRRQLIWWAISFIFFILASRINYHYYKGFFSNSVMVILIGLLALVLIFGTEIGGSKRWLSLWFFSIQPSEFVKIALVILFSSNLDRKYKDNKHIKNIVFPSFFILCVVAILIFLEPDLGSVIVIGLIIFIVLFVGGLKFKHLFGLGFIGLAVTVSFLFLEDYRIERIFAFINGIRESGGAANFQISQSLIALGSGNLTGLGLHNSVQKYSYLPEAHTDFIFAIIGEELGLVGTILIVILFILFMFFGIRVCIKTKDYFGRMMAAGLTSIIIVPAIINISVVIGMIPVKGLALPFISFGGSSLLTSMISVGILLNISRHNTSPERIQNDLDN
ncbi:MAG: putative lipid II flippase FtsW [Actinobacteria bacterium]|nr:putative lipid II flippase FtsW [Actinomycetota bacterium]MBL7123627.1 putative lipid II flippase FtsW [Actinomycetota bacterium]